MCELLSLSLFNFQIDWPANLVDEPDNSLSNSQPGSLLPPPRVPSLARRIRISLEHYLLAPSNLLNQVAHVDPTPSEQIVWQVRNAEDRKEDQSTSSYPVFVRFKTKVAARQLIEFAELSRSERDDESQKSLPSSLGGCILSSAAEEAYCQAIAASLVGPHARRRRIQRNRRQRVRHQKGDQPSVSDGPVKTSDSFSTGHTVNNSGGDHCSTTSSAKDGHIIFTE